jgi:hypothetical protein
MGLIPATGPDFDSCNGIILLGIKIFIAPTDWKNGIFINFNRLLGKVSNSAGPPLDGALARRRIIIKFRH